MASTQNYVPTLTDKLLVLPILAKALYAAVTRLILSPVSSGPRANTLLKDIIFAALRVNLAQISPAQEQWTNPTTEANYLAFAKSKSVKPEVSTLGSGVKAAWFGPQTAEKIVLYLHGGGYVLSASAGHIQWLSELQKDLSKKQDVAVVLLMYTLAPHAQYPTQLTQAAECLNWLITSQGKKPRNIVVAGDSAGGNLTLALYSHILHPHPDIAENMRVTLSEPLAGTVLISPWVKFVPEHDDSVRRNQGSDMVTPAAAKRWSSLYLGRSSLDNYNSPGNADWEWFSGLDKVSKDLLIWGGGGEILIDSIQVMERKLSKAHRHVEYVEQPGAAHEDFILEKLFGYTEKAQGTMVVENWIAARF